MGSIPEYPHSAPDDLGFLPTSRRQTGSYSEVEIRNTAAGGPVGFGMRDIAAPDRSGGIDGTWRNTSHLREDSMEWGFTVGHHVAGGMEENYAMTGMEERLEAAGSAVGFQDQGFGKPPEIDVDETTSTDPYSSTDVGSRSIYFPLPGSPPAGTSEHPKYLRWQERNNGVTAGQQPRLDVVESGANFRPSSCLLGGCGGAYIFKNLQSYRTHLKNVHHKSVFCRVRECCRSTQPFNSESDRRRHHQAKHDPRKEKLFRCERQICPARVKAWTRKDKLAAHNKKYHMQMPCQICSLYFDNCEELLQHTNVDHGSISSEERMRHEWSCYNDDDDDRL